MLAFLVDNIFVVFAGKVFPTDSRHSHGHKLCPSPSRHISILIRSGVHTVLALRPVRSGWHLSSTSHIDTSTTFCPLITQTLRIISVRCIPPSLRSKTRRRATLLLPTWICSCQLVGTVNFILPFTTNVTISISILQTFRSWVATSHLRQPMAFLSHNLSDTPGLAPLMNVLFWGRCHFPISFSGRDMSRNVWNRL